MGRCVGREWSLTLTEGLASGVIEPDNDISHPMRSSVTPKQSLKALSLGSLLFISPIMVDCAAGQDFLSEATFFDNKKVISVEILSLIHI